MTRSKRLMDVTISAMLLVVLLPLMALTAIAVLICDGRPIFFVSERAKSATENFSLFKFRTMHPNPDDLGASGGHNTGRISRLGRVLRRSRLDEIPQIFNVLKGDMSLVGPRPPLRLHVDRFPILLGEVLKMRPGVTGLSTLYFFRHEDRLLRNCKCARETEQIYERCCIPRKARLDLIYARNHTLFLDSKLLLATLFK